jgi:hypothetical protein
MTALFPRWPTGNSREQRGEKRSEGATMADALQINCALWGMLVCGEVKVAQWMNLLF